VQVSWNCALAALVSLDPWLTGLQGW
jgi:hypothetical protein